MLEAAAYDLFISYADADHAWVEGYLLDALEQSGARLHSEAAFALGAPRLVEFERAIRQSRRTLLILSPAYLADNFAQFTDLLAANYGLESATWPVIPLFLHAVVAPSRVAMLQPLDATEPARWAAVVERLCAELQRPLPQAAAAPECPYPGMAPFGEADHARFFGRAREVRELIERLRLHPFVTVIGPSGSGKSSLVYAGLLPALRKSRLFGDGEWLTRNLRPGDQPMAALASALAPRQRPADPARTDQDAMLSALLSGSNTPPPSNRPSAAPGARIGDDPAAAVGALLATVPHARRLLLFVDQFEETYAVARQDALLFQETLARLAATPGCFVVVTVRADFYPDLMVSPLWPQIQAHRLEVVPLNDDGLRAAIVQPAEAAGAFVEAALVERLLADAAGEPGALPLIQETLVLLWERLERRFLPLRAYTALVLPRSAYAELDGTDRTGLQVALARRADAALADLAPEQQSITRRILLRLIQFGEGRLDTRRQQPVAALRASGDDPLLFERTLRHLADRRLLTLGGRERGGGQADIAHEALIAGWPRLRTWMSELRAAEQTRRRLETQAAKWAARTQQGLGGALLDEVELREAEQWLQSSDAAELGYSPALPELVAASRAAIEASERKREEARQRELSQARALANAERRSRRRLQGLVVILAGISLLAVGVLVRPYWLSFIARGEMATIPQGRVVIGSDSPDAYPNERRQWTTTLPAFKIERFEVSNRQYQLCFSAGVCSLPDDPIQFAEPELSNHPVVGVTAIQAAEYCRWIGRRLPTELEWERAARGAAPGRTWPWGEAALTANRANVAVEGKTRDTQPVDGLTDGVSIDGLSLFNLIGNVWEWTSSFEQDSYTPYDLQQVWDGRNLAILKTRSLVYRGGGWQDALDRLTERRDLSGSRSSRSIGIRCALDR